MFFFYRTYPYWNVDGIPIIHWWSLQICWSDFITFNRTITTKTLTKNCTLYKLKRNRFGLKLSTLKYGWCFYKYAGCHYSTSGVRRFDRADAGYCMGLYLTHINSIISIGIEITYLGRSHSHWSLDGVLKTLFVTSDILEKVKYLRSGDDMIMLENNLNSRYKPIWI